MDGVRNEDVRRRAGIERVLASRVEQSITDGLDTWREWMSTVWLEGRLMAEVNGGRVWGRPRLG